MNKPKNQLSSYKCQFLLSMKEKKPYGWKFTKETSRNAHFIIMRFTAEQK